MNEPRHIVMLGNSVILGTVGASVRRYPQYRVSSLGSIPDIAELEALRPDVMFFDLESNRPEAAFTLLETSPGLMLIGISPDSNLVKVWSGKQLRELSTRELMEVIDKQKAIQVLNEIRENKKINT